MPAVNCKAPFARSVMLGLKRTTIRPGCRFKAGDRFVAYYGMRKKGCFKLIEGKVVSVDTVRIIKARNPAESAAINLCISIDGAVLTTRAARALAKGDGFASVLEFYLFFAELYELPFDGQLVQWEPNERKPGELQRELLKLDCLLAGITVNRDKSQDGLKKALSRKRAAARSANIIWEESAPTTLEPAEIYKEQPQDRVEMRFTERPIAEHPDIAAIRGRYPSHGGTSEAEDPQPWRSAAP